MQRGFFCKQPGSYFSPRHALASVSWNLVLCTDSPNLQSGVAGQAHERAPIGLGEAAEDGMLGPEDDMGQGPLAEAPGGAAGQAGGGKRSWGTSGQDEKKRVQGSGAVGRGKGRVSSASNADEDLALAGTSMQHNRE